MVTKMDIISELTDSDDKNACGLADRIVSESLTSDIWYKYFDDFASLLSHPKSYVRNRALNILSANAEWDYYNRFDAILSDYLTHITDEKPITSRICIKALIKVGLAKPRYIPEILSSIKGADLSRYKDTMRPLIERDILKTEEILKEKLRSSSNQN